MEQPPANPYQTPSAASDPAFATTAPHVAFRESKLFAWLAGSCIAVTLPYSLLIFLLMKEVVVLPMEALELVDGLHGIFFLCGVIFYCIWKYRSACNAQLIYGAPLMYTPGWCVGYYFIPLMMLFRPYQCMKDIYEKTYYILDRRSPNGLILLWWLSWIFSGILERITMKSDDMELMIASQSLSLVSALLVLWVIATLTRRQYEIMRDPQLQEKIGNTNPYTRRLPDSIPAVPIQRPQIQETASRQESPQNPE